MSKVAFITGITGQDGSYLAELLLEKQYKVYGIVRRTSLVYSYSRIDHIRNKLNLEYGDLTDGSSITNIIHKIINENSNFEVLEIYNLAAQSHVKISFETPEYTSLVDGIGTLKILEAIRILPSEIQSKIKFYQAGTSEMYGEVRENPQNENTPFNPQSPYACAKVYSHFLVKNYREGYGLYACNGILFNHESSRRGANFVTAKIVNGVKDIMKGKIPFLQLGNIHSKRDWGHSKDYVYGMWLMMQQEKPDDYVLATGVTTTVKEFIEKAFKYVNIEIEWEGEGEEECGINKEDRTTLVVIDKKYFRPCEVDLLLGDPSKAREKLGWKLNYDLDGLIKDMFENEN
jgi:GDPmannose 4,6-dehydratase|uniref:GDP-mannose 4,6-dehydratase n=1 Tax=viral metagenome TaxID=1070528 RepID=A0A6C0CWH2_9ZZZZ